MPRRARESECWNWKKEEVYRGEDMAMSWGGGKGREREKRKKLSKPDEVPEVEEGRAGAR